MNGTTEQNSYNTNKTNKQIKDCSRYQFLSSTHVALYCSFLTSLKFVFCFYFTLLLFFFYIIHCKYILLLPSHPPYKELIVLAHCLFHAVKPSTITDKRMYQLSFYFFHLLISFKLCEIAIY